MIQYFKDIIKEFINARHTWKIHLILELNFEYYNNDRIAEKEIYIYHIHKTIFSSTNTDETINCNIKIRQLI